MNEQPLHEHTRQALDHRAESLDASTLSKLRQARAHAVEQGLKRRRAWLYGWLPAAGLATAAATLMAINLWYGQLQAPDPALLESLALEEIQQEIDDLEFYEWLAGSNGNSV